MSAQEQVESLELLPNRLAVAPFGPGEVDMILGGNEYETRLRASNFNWVAAYLCEEVGIFEHEIPDWFRGEAKGLDGESPISVWKEKDGFWRVFEYAQLFKKQVEEDLGNEDLSDPRAFRSSGIAENAIGVIARSFESVGVDLSEQFKDEESNLAIHNPADENSPIISWRGRKRNDSDNIEQYRIHLDEGARRGMFFAVRYLPQDGKPFMVQTGVGWDYKSEPQQTEDEFRRCDMDGLAPSAGEIAAFVIPVANETQNNSLRLMS